MSGLRASGPCRALHCALACAVQRRHTRVCASATANGNAERDAARRRDRKVARSEGEDTSGPQAKRVSVEHDLEHLPA